MRHCREIIKIPRQTPRMQKELEHADRQSCCRRSQASQLVLFVISRSFGRGALGFAQCSLLLPLSLLVLGSCACRPLSLSPVSAVIWFKCHWISVMYESDLLAGQPCLSAMDPTSRAMTSREVEDSLSVQTRDMDRKRGW